MPDARFLMTARAMTDELLHDYWTYLLKEPKNDQRLTQPRHDFHEAPHRNRYRKAP